MTGDYTKVALRHDERWESAPAQQGRALLDHELNLDAAASIRRDRQLAGDAIGAAGVVHGSTAFEIGVASGGPFDLSVAPGHMWVGGSAAIAPTAFTYSSQDQIDPLPAAGRVLVYLDVFDEHVQPAEQPDLVDPALAPTDTAARTRVGYRVRVTPTTATTCAAAWAGFAPAALSSGGLDVHRVGPVVPPDPCDPPGDAQGLVPDGLLRVEVLDSGSAASARFAWSYENGSAAVGVAAIAGDTVTLHPSSAVQFGTDLVEISWLARRADRASTGSLYQILAVTPSAIGDVLTLDRTVTAPAGAAGLVARRWDGQVVGATGLVAATRGGNDLGIRFRATGGTYRAGDWWGARVRAADGVETLTAAAADGVRHAFAPLAIVDIDGAAVLHDCRPVFRPLTELETVTPCTVVVRPGDDLQAAVDSLPPGGGEVCLSAGTFEVPRAITVDNRSRVRITGVGPATVVRVEREEMVFRFRQSTEVELLDLALVAGVAATPATADGINGAATFEGCQGVTVAGVAVLTPDGGLRRQAAITVRAERTRRPERVTIRSCDLVVGGWQVGVLVTDGSDVAVTDNRVRLAPAREGLVPVPGRSLVAEELTRLFTASFVPDAATPAPGRGTGPGNLVVRLPSGRDVTLVERSPVRALATDFAARPGTVGRSDAAAFTAFIAAALADPTRLGPAATNELVAVTRALRAVGQGIVIGGDRGTAIRISDNVVRDALQGIHVGVSRPGGARERIDDVLISGNTVHLTVPNTFGRDRHAIFVGNADSVQISDLRATATRQVVVAGCAATPLDAVRLIGFYGPYVAVRGVSVHGCTVGVRAQPLGAAPNRRVWSLSEVMASGVSGAVGVVAPSTFTRTLTAP